MKNKSEHTNTFILSYLIPFFVFKFVNAKIGGIMFSKAQALHEGISFPCLQMPGAQAWHSVKCDAYSCVFVPNFALKSVYVYETPHLIYPKTSRKFKGTR